MRARIASPHPPEPEDEEDEEDEEVAIPEIGTTAVLVILPDAEPLLDLARQVDPELVRPLPAHVSLLYPGPQPSLEALDDIGHLGRHLPGEVDLRDVQVSSNGFVGIGVPDLDDASCLFRARFPSLVPYNGRFGGAPPAHLTLALGATDAQAGQVRQSVVRELPCRSRVVGPCIVVRTGSGWQRVTSSA